MKKGQLLNSHISAVIAEMGHTDTIVIADAGLPIPDSAERIDLAITKGIPDFLTVLHAVLKELQIEKVTLAKEIKTANTSLNDVISTIIKETEKNQHNTVSIDFVSHEKFKEMTANAKAVIRTGECTPYANIILHSGVIF